nr:hypothetical protein [Dendronalium sp. ChiSLP03b]
MYIPDFVKVWLLLLQYLDRSLCDRISRTAFRVCTALAWIAFDI